MRITIADDASFGPAPRLFAAGLRTISAGLVFGDCPTAQILETNVRRCRSGGNHERRISLIFAAADPVNIDGEKICTNVAGRSQGRHGVLR